MLNYFPKGLKIRSLINRISLQHIWGDWKILLGNAKSLSKGLP